MSHKNPPIKQKYIKTPEELLQLWEDYKQYVDENPDIQQVATGKGVQIISVKKPYLKSGFYSYVFKKRGHHIKQYFENTGGAYTSYLDVCTHIKDEWTTDQVEGTITGRYKAPNLVARLNGISEKQEVTHDGTVEIVMTKGKTLL